MQNSSSEMLHPTDDASEYNNENEVADILDSMPHSDSNTLIARLRAENQALRAQICHLSDEVKSLQVHNQSLLMELEPVRALKAGKVWLVQQGFAEEDARSEIRIDGQLKSPLQYACEQGNLDACRWLHANGASKDINTANNDGATTMWIACQNGHLSVCQWLFEVGASADITRANNDGATPMSRACHNGHLQVCQWLYELGASADISRANNVGITPMRIACHNGHLPVCQWLILNGASNDEDDHVNEEVVIRDVFGSSTAFDLQTWTQEMIAVHSTFLDVLLRGSVLVPLSQQHAPPQQRCRLPMLNRGVLEVVGSYLGLVIGRQIRNVQEVRAVLSSVLDQE